MESRFQPRLEKYSRIKTSDAQRKSAAVARTNNQPNAAGDVKKEVMFSDLVNALVEDVLNMAALVPRVADCDDGQEMLSEQAEPSKDEESEGAQTGNLTSQNGYRDLMGEFVESEQHRHEFLNRVPLACDKAVKFKHSLERYAYLWNDDRAEFMRCFLTYGRVISAEEMDAVGIENIEECAPSLDQFKQQVSLL